MRVSKQHDGQCTSVRQQAGERTLSRPSAEMQTRPGPRALAKGAAKPMGASSWTFRRVVRSAVRSASAGYSRRCALLACSRLAKLMHACCAQPGGFEHRRCSCTVAQELSAEPVFVVMRHWSVLQSQERGDREGLDTYRDNVRDCSMRGRRCRCSRRGSCSRACFQLRLWLVCRGVLAVRGLPLLLHWRHRWLHCLFRLMRGLSCSLQLMDACCLCSRAPCFRSVRMLCAEHMSPHQALPRIGSQRRSQRHSYMHGTSCTCSAPASSFASREPSLGLGVSNAGVVAPSVLPLRTQRPRPLACTCPSRLQCHS